MFWRIAPLCLVLFATAGSLHSKDSEAIKAGLVAWRKVDANGRSCIGCHSPLGLELAYYNFSDADILRRARAHVGDSDAQAIVDMIHALRREGGISSPRDPMTDAPAQPGGAVLPGTSAAERDFAFGKQIDGLLPLMTRGTVESVAKAKEVEAAVLGLDLSRLRVGFQFDRLSEDGFHGSEHAVIADWIPDTPAKLSSDAVQARDKYAADPSEKNLTAFLAALPTGFLQGPVADSLSMVKYRALLHLQAELAHPERHDLEPKLRVENPFWDLAELARGAEHVPLGGLGLPEDIRQKKDPGPALSEQFKAMELPWYWLGWTVDPGLQHSRWGRKDRRGDYFGLTLLANGPYPMHCAFMFLRKQLQTSFDPRAWNSQSPQHFELEYSTFLLNRNYLYFAPKEPASRSLYLRFVANAFRTSLYLLLDETRRSHLTGPPFEELSQARLLADFVESQQPSAQKAMEDLLARINAEFAKSQHVKV